MKYVLVIGTALLLGACAGTSNNYQDDPDDKVIQTGSHIPVKDKSAGKASSTADADALIRTQKLGSPNAGGGGK